MNLGIDLGTTFSLAAYVNGQGVPALVPDVLNANAFRTPSVIYVAGRQALVGDAIEELLSEEPGLAVARGFKLRMGQEPPAYRDPDGRAWSPEALSALVLKKLLRDVDTFMAENIDTCVITVPANFNDQQRRATQLAARLAGLSRVHLIEEPVAAAAFYGVTERSPEQTLFVYDFGGGTFDATLLQLSEGSLHVIATEGDARLGGQRVDEALIELLASEFRRQHGVSPLEDPAAREQLRRFAEEAKIALASPGRNQVRKTLVLAGRVFELAIAREQLDRIVLPLVEDSLRACQRCLEGAALSWSLVDRVLLTGGSSLLPQVAQRLTQVSGKRADALQSRQPHQAVAYGAALLAEALGRKPGVQPLNAVAPYHLGLRVRDPATGQPKVEVMIKRNAPLPAKHTATFYTSRPEQTRLVLDVVQAKGDQEVVASLGHFAFGPLLKPRKNYPIEVTLAYDEQGIARITAKDMVTGTALEREFVSDENPDLHRFAEARMLVQAVEVNR
jgi:molecular chaperone DnaK